MNSAGKEERGKQVEDSEKIRITDNEQLADNSGKSHMLGTDPPSPTQLPRGEDGILSHHLLFG